MLRKSTGMKLGLPKAAHDALVNSFGVGHCHRRSPSWSFDWLLAVQSLWNLLTLFGCDSIPITTVLVQAQALDTASSSIRLLPSLRSADEVHGLTAR